MQRDHPATTSRKLLDANRSPGFLSMVCFIAGSLQGSSEEGAAVLASFGSCLIRRISLSVTGFERVASHQVQSYCLSFLGFHF